MVGAWYDEYKLRVGNYSGNAGDALRVHHNMPFTTVDNDNDAWHSNCATRYKGAWWYNACHRAQLTGELFSHYFLQQ